MYFASLMLIFAEAAMACYPTSMTYKESLHFRAARCVTDIARITSVGELSSKPNILPILAHNHVGRADARFAG